MLIPSDMAFAVAGVVTGDHCRDHVPMYCGIQYNYAGPMELQIGDNDPLYLDGAWAFITYPGIRFRYRISGDQSHYFRFICMKPESIREYINSGLLPQEQTPIQINFPDKFSRSMDEAISLINCGVPERLPRAIWQVLDLLLQLKEQETGNIKEGSWHDKHLKELIKDIRNHPEQQFDFAREAAKMNVGFRHFRRLFKSVTGLAPTQFQLQCRMTRAVALLSETQESIATIGQKVGIDDPYYFSTLFKQRFHLSPRAYRREFYRDTN